MNIQDAIDVLSRSEEFRNTELRVVTKSGGTRPVKRFVLRNGYLFLVPDFDADKTEIEVTND